MSGCKYAHPQLCAPRADVTIESVDAVFVRPIRFPLRASMMVCTPQLACGDYRGRRSPLRRLSRPNERGNRQREHCTRTHRDSHCPELCASLLV